MLTLHATLSNHQSVFHVLRREAGEIEKERTMKRRTFFRRLFGIAGFQFHNGDAIWSALSVGDELRLVRESSNAHDPDAVAVYFQDDKLGYVPGAENSAISQMLDRGENLQARISRLLMDEDPWQRVRISIFRV
jgi:hypothetical protein